LNNKIFGRIGEDAALAYLKEKKYKIVGMNYNTRHGELDIIALRRGVLVFVEVKARRDLKYGLPSDSVGRQKISHLKSAAYEFCKIDGAKGKVPFYLGKLRYTRKYKKRRFDVIELIADEQGVKRLTHTENVF